jgi:hypothetical protein
LDYLVKHFFLSVYFVDSKGWRRRKRDFLALILSQTSLKDLQDPS